MQPWAGQAALALGRLGAQVSTDQPAPVSIADLTTSAAGAVHRQLCEAQGTRHRQYVDATGVDAAEDDAVGQLPVYLHAVPRRRQWRALAQLRTGSHWLAEETGRWQRQRRDERLCPHCLVAGDRHVQDAAHSILHCPHTDTLRAQYHALFAPAHCVSLHAFFDTTDPIQLASFCRALYSLHH